MTVARELGFDQAPFYLDEDALRWVEETHASLDVASKVGQLLVTLLPNDTPDDDVIRLARSGVGSVSRFANGRPDFLLRSLELLRENAAVPILMSTDMEFEEVTTIGGASYGTRFPNQLLVAAARSVEGAEHMATIAAREGGALGFNWSFTPVADIAFNFRNSLVPTRSFGDDPELVADLVSRYVTKMESLGMASTTKHFPGDGVDDRDQHTVPSKNALTMAEWRETFGAVYRAAISAGTRTMMVGHISLPAYLLERNGDPATAYLPGTFAPHLLEDLLRGELGFNGLIVSDATEMGGFESLGLRRDLVGACIQAGCDMLLFNQPDDYGLLLDAMASGQLSHERLEVASLRVLALKASLGLHRGHTAPIVVPATDRARHADWATEVARKGVTLVRDERDDLPLTPSTHPRILLAMAEHRRNVFRELPDLEIERLLTETGFEVERFTPTTKVDPTRHSALLLVVANEAKQGKIHLRVDWTQLLPGFPNYMTRHFRLLPTVMLSFGSPYTAYDAPECPIFINAYSPVLPAQEAAIDALTGKRPFLGASPVDAFAGLDVGELIADRAIPHVGDYSRWRNQRAGKGDHMVGH